MQKLENSAKELMKADAEKQKKRGRVFTPIRAMIVGIPNVGKSTLINQLCGSASTKTGDRPGVTRGRQWIKTVAGFELLDTPGILWPKFDDTQVGVHLAITGAVSDNVVDMITLANTFLQILNKIDPQAVNRRYKLTPDITSEASSGDLLTSIGEARGFKIKGGAIDLERTAIILLDEYRAGKLGKLTLELPQAQITAEPTV